MGTDEQGRGGNNVWSSVKVGIQHELIRTHQISASFSYHDEQTTLLVVQHLLHLTKHPI